MVHWKERRPVWAIIYKPTGQLCSTDGTRTRLFQNKKSAQRWIEDNGMRRVTTPVRVEVGYREVSRA